MHISFKDPCEVEGVVIIICCYFPQPFSAFVCRRTSVRSCQLLHIKESSKRWEGRGVEEKLQLGYLPLESLKVNMDSLGDFSLPLKNETTGFWHHNKAVYGKMLLTTGFPICRWHLETSHYYNLPPGGQNQFHWRTQLLWRTLYLAPHVPPPIS